MNKFYETFLITQCHIWPFTCHACSLIMYLTFREYIVLLYGIIPWWFFAAITVKGRAQYCQI